MPISVKTDRSIRGRAGPEGRLEIIEDVGIDPDHHHKLLSAFTVPTSVIHMFHHAVELWEMVQQHVNQHKNTLFLCPGNGAWLIERSLRSHNIKPRPVQSVEVSRDGASDIRVEGNPDQIVILEDIVETGSTATNLRSNLVGVRCLVTLATMLWHDREAQTRQVLEVFAGYDQVLIPVRIRSNNELDDVRSLSTLARKHEKTSNHRYSRSREQDFVAAMRSVLDLHPWLRRLGIDLGYRRDEHSISTFGQNQSA